MWVWLGFLQLKLQLPSMEMLGPQFEAIIVWFSIVLCDEEVLLRHILDVMFKL